MSEYGDGRPEPQPDAHALRAWWPGWPTVKRVAATVLLVAVVDFAVVAWFSQDSEPPGPGIGVAARSPAAILGRHGQRVLRSSVAANLAIAPINHVLAYTADISVGGSRRRDIALTFDDGPGPYTSRVLGVLRRTHTPATFFVVGEQAALFPALIRAEAKAGNEIGDHTETHPLMTALSPSAQRAQIVQAAHAIERAGAPAPHLWRPPYGAFSSTTLSILHSVRMLNVLWTVDTSDYMRPGAARIAAAAISGARPGAIILMHDGGGDRSQTVAALPGIIATLRRRGYHLVTVSQLLADDPPTRNHSRPRASGGEAGGHPSLPPRRRHK